MAVHVVITPQEAHTQRIDSIVHGQQPQYVQLHKQELRYNRLTV